MKHNRVIALAAGALLAFGATAVVVPRAFAQSSPAPSAQLQNNDSERADKGNERETLGRDGDAEQFQSGEQNGREEREVLYRDPIPAGKPDITATAAIAAAQTFLKTSAVVGKLQLEDENGQLVYSVWIGGSDVKVDAMTGKVLGTGARND